MLKSEKNTALVEANSTVVAPLQPKYLKIPAAVRYSSIGRSRLYELMDANAIRSYKIGSARIIDRESLDAFITSQTVK